MFFKKEDNKYSMSVPRWIVFIFAMLIIAGFYFRVANIPSNEFMFTDGITYWKMAKLAEIGNYYFYQGKPGHVLLLWFSGKVFGWNGSIPIWVSVITGFLSVWVVYKIGNRWFGKEAGILSAVLLAIYPWNIYYSRNSGATNNAIFFLLLSIFFYLKSRKEFPKKNNQNYEWELFSDQSFLWMVLSGLAMGFAFSCHYNLGLMPLIFLFFEIHFLIEMRKNFLLGPENSNLDLVVERKRAWLFFPIFLKRNFVLFLSMLLPLAFFNFLHLYLFYLNKGGLGFDPSRIEKVDVVISYFQQIFIQLKTSTTETWKTEFDLSFLWKLFLNNHGIPFTVIFFISLIKYFKKLKSNCNIAFVLPLAVPIVYIVFMLGSNYTGAGRSLAFVPPFVSLIMGFAFSEYLKEKWGKTVIPLALIIILASNIPLLISLVQMQNVDKQISVYIENEKIEELTVLGEEAKGSLYGVDVGKEYFDNFSSLLKNKGTNKIEGEKGKRLLTKYMNVGFLKNMFKCQEEKTWNEIRGSSKIDFEFGKVERVWDLNPQKGNKLNGIVMLQNCQI
jgi:asparagine N-glycosylation enzyme membrane subunit Stt3